MSANVSSSVHRDVPSVAGDLRAALKRAARAVRIGVVTLVASALSLTLFFGGAGSIFGPINDILLAITLVLLIPAIMATAGLADRTWFSAAAWIAIAGIVETAIGNFLLVTGVISLQTSFLTLGIGFLAIMAWAVPLAVLAFRGELLSRTLGWWSVAFAGGLGVAAVAWAVVPLAVWSVFGAVFFVAIVGWLMALARSLERAA